MKKVFNLSLMLGFILATFSACINEDTPVSYAINNANEIVENFNVDKLPHDRAEIYSGEVYIRAASDNSLLIFVGDFDSKNDRHAFLVQTGTSDNSSFESSIINAQVLFFRKSIIVNDINERKAYLFTLSGEANSEYIKDLDVEFTSIFKGYGISKYPNFEVIANADVNGNIGVERAADDLGLVGDDPPFIVFCKCFDDVVDTGDLCTAGGSGSSSCSISDGNNSCSTSCDSGKYSCCYFR